MRLTREVSINPYKKITDAFEWARSLDELMAVGMKYDTEIEETRKTNPSCYRSILSAFSFYEGMFKGTLKHKHRIHGNVNGK